jgi:hypothetical protein
VFIHTSKTAKNGTQQVLTWQVEQAASPHVLHEVVAEHHHLLAVVLDPDTAAAAAAADRIQDTVHLRTNTNLAVVLRGSSSSSSSEQDTRHSSSRPSPACCPYFPL